MAVLKAWDFRDTVEGLLKGSIDMHVHFGPEPPPRGFPPMRVARLLNALQTAEQARRAGMRAIVLKSHDYPTAPLCHVVREVVPGIELFGNVCTDRPSGGLNPFAVEIAAQLGTQLCFMPTLDAAAHFRRMNRQEQGISILSEDGKLLPAVHDILDLVVQYDMCLCTGHISAEEDLVLVADARRKGIQRISVTHVPSDVPMEARKKLAEMGAFLEHVFLFCLPGPRQVAPAAVAAAIKEVGPEHCIMSTDSGHVIDPEPAQMYRMFIAHMLDCGLEPREIELMAKVNPAFCLGLD